MGTFGRTDLASKSVSTPRSNSSVDASPSPVRLAQVLLDCVDGCSVPDLN